MRGHCEQTFISQAHLFRVIALLAILALRFSLASLRLRLASARADGPQECQKVPLHSGWSLQSACQFTAHAGANLHPGFSTEGWHSTMCRPRSWPRWSPTKPTPIRTTRKNLRDIPGATYPIGKNFSLLPMPKDSPFRCSWWYRTEFTLAPNFDGRHVWLYFGGINNRANIWLNGHQIANSQDVAGAYQHLRIRHFAICRIRGRQNALAVETIAQTDKDLGINWVDWNPAPPDKDMGLWREVYLQDSGAVAIRLPAGHHSFSDASLEQANLTVETELHNATDLQITGVLNGRIGDVKFNQTYILKPHETAPYVSRPRNFRSCRSRIRKYGGLTAWATRILQTLALRFHVGNERIGRADRYASASAKSPSRTECAKRAPVLHQRQKNPDPRRRLVARHAAPPRSRPPAH